jgi:2-dehydropantoate 2-reductase
MRIVVYGIGAIGGTVASALALSDQDVVGIARGAQLDAIRENGLEFCTPSGAHQAQFPCHGDPSEVDWRDDDIVLLTMKSQDTLGALNDLRRAGVDRQAVVCAQNGVANERMTLRFFENTYGLLVMMPSAYESPGRIGAFGAPKHGIFDIGRYPAGRDGTAEALAEALSRAKIAAFAVDDVMKSKYGKLLMNLRNVIEAAVGGEASEPFFAVARREAEAVLAAAGIEYLGNESDARRDSLMKLEPVEGVRRLGSSSSQSLIRGTGSIETDYLNGEIVLLGRLHGVPTPANAYFCRLGAKMVRVGAQPGSVPANETTRGLKALGVDI